MRPRAGGRIGVTLTLAAALFYGRVAAADSPLPALRFDRTEHNFGEVAQGDRVSAEFVFRNVGPVPLTLSPPVVGCDCEAEIVGALDLSPSDSGTIVFRCDTSSMAGLVRRSATVHSSDVGRRAELLTLVGEVRLDVLAEPDRPYVGDVLRGQRLDDVFSLSLGSSEGKEVRIVGASVDGSVLSVERAGRGRSFALRIDSTAPLGAFTQDVVVSTTSLRFPSVVVPVTGKVVEKLPKKRW